MNTDEIGQKVTMGSFGNSFIFSRFARFLMLGAGVFAIASTLLPWYSSHLRDLSLDQAASGYQVESLHTAEKAVSYNPFSIEARFALAGAQERMGWHVEARNTLIETTEMQPLNYATWEQLAVNERDRWGMPQEATEHFEMAMTLNREDTQLRIQAKKQRTD